MKKVKIVLGTTVIGGTFLVSGMFNTIAAAEVEKKVVENTISTKSNLEVEIKKSQQDIEKIKQEIENLVKKLDESKRLVQQNKDTISNIEKEIKNIEEIKTKISKLEIEKENLMNQIKKEKELILEKNKESAKIQEKVENAVKKVEYEKNKLGSLKNPDELKEQMDKKQEEKKNNEKIVLDNTKSIEDVKEERNTAVEKLEKVQKNISLKKIEKAELEKTRTKEEIQKQKNVDYKKQEMSKVEVEIKETSHVLKQKVQLEKNTKEELVREEEKKNKNIPMLISDEFISAIKESLKYSGKIPDSVADKIEQSSNNLIGPEENENWLRGGNSPLLKALAAISSSDKRSADVRHLTEKQTEELNEYAANLYRQIRNAFGFGKENQLITTKETNKLGKRFADVHEEVTRKRAGGNAKFNDAFKTGHLSTSLTIQSNIPIEVGIAKRKEDLTIMNGYSYFENLAFFGEGYAEYRRGYNYTTMGGLKASIYDSIAQFLYRDKGSNYGHTRNVVRGAGYYEKGSQFYIGFAHTKNYTTILFDESVINDPNATLTKIPKIESSKSIVQKIEKLKGNLNNYIKEITKIKSELSNKQKLLNTLSIELTSLQKNNDKKIVRIQQLDKEIDNLSKEKTVLEVTIPKKEQRIQLLQSEVVQSKKKVTNLEREYTELLNEYRKNIDLFKDFNLAKKELKELEIVKNKFAESLLNLKNNLTLSVNKINTLENVIQNNIKIVQGKVNLIEKITKEQKALHELEKNYATLKSSLDKKQNEYKNIFKKNSDLKAKLALINSIEKPKKTMGWQKVNGLWYFFDKKGFKTGWIFTEDKWYYLNSSGVMQIGWLLDGNKWYYLNSSGAMETGWIQNKNTWYFMNESGAMQTGWILDGNKWYYLNSSGAMETGWVQSGNKWYFMNKSGAMQTGWVEVSGKWYYFDKSGALLTNTITPDGYYVNANGEWA